MIKIGRIVNTFGIRGQVKVIADTDFPQERFAPGAQVFVLDQDQVKSALTIEKAQLHKGTYLLSFEGYNNINQVEPFKGMWLTIDPSDQHQLEEDAYYHHQIIGLDIITSQGVNLGKVKDILTLGSNDVWVIKRPEPGKKDVLIPFIDDVVKSVDLESNQALIELMEGLVDDED